MADPSPKPFLMQSAHDAMAAGFVHIEEQVKGIEQAVVGNPGLAFDLAKTLIESTCRVVMDERSVRYSSNDDLPKLFKSATKHLHFLPATASNEGELRKSLLRTLSGLSTAIQGICELRNQCGFASHGSGSPRPVMEGVHALLAAEAADTIVGFLHRVHRQDRTLASKEGANFEGNTAFNKSLDEDFGSFRVLDGEFHASEVLFSLEPETYRIYLAEFSGDSEAGTAVDGEAMP